MLPKKNRVDKKIIDQIFKKGRFYLSPHLTFKFISLKDGSNTQISFTAPKSVVKSAVKRNLLRRRGYNIIAKYIGSLPKGLKGVFIFSKNSFELFGGKNSKREISKNNLENEIQRIISQIN